MKLYRAPSQHLFFYSQLGAKGPKKRNDVATF